MVRASGPPFMLPDVRTDARAVTILNPGISTGGIGCQQTKYWKKYLPEGFAKLACAIKEKSGKNIWCYTGYTFETLLRNPLQAKLLQYIDVLVDGKFKQELRDESLCFRGSKNQRLIDVQASLRTEEVVAYNYNPVPRIA